MPRPVTDAIWTPPTTLAEAKLLVMHEKPNGWERRWEITNAGFGDEHIPTLLNARPPLRGARFFTDCW